VEIDISRKGQRRRYWHMCAAGVPRSAACMRAFQQPKILIAVLVGPFFDSVSSLLTVLLLIDETFVCYLPTVFQVNSPM